MPDAAPPPDDEESFAELRARIAALEAELHEVVQVAAHDLGEPLSMVTSCLGLLERRYGPGLDDPARELIGYATGGATRMRALLDDLLRYAVAGGGELVREPVDVAVVLEDVRRSLGPAIAEAGATIVVDGPLPVVAADAVQLGQLLQNLLSNAVKFRAPGRGARVTVGARRDPDDRAWLLEVADDGIGIDPGQHERVFRAFLRLHGDDAYAGTGLGLAICHRIVERLGGSITVASAPGEGSTFTVRIPDVEG